MSPLPLPPPDKRAIVPAVVAERRSTLQLLRGLPPAAFDTPTALPGWRIREVVAHLVTTDRGSVTGGILPSALGRGTDRLETWNERVIPAWAARPVPDLIDGLERWGRRFERLIRTIPAPAWRANITTNWGPGSGSAIWARAYDEWVHRQDIRRALGRPDERIGLSAPAGLLLRAIGYLTPRRMGGRAGRVAISLDGGELAEWLVDLSARSGGPVGPADEGSDARIQADGPAFIMASAGRDPFDSLRSSGELTIEGDEALAQAFLSNVRLV